MATTIYVDFDAGTDGDGTTGSPYNNLASAEAHFTNKDLVTQTETFTIKLRNTSAGTEVITAGVSFGSYTTDATYFITIEPDTGYEPTGAGPVVKIESTSNHNYLIFPAPYTVIDGIWMRAAYAFNHMACIDDGTGNCTFRNLILEGDYASSGFGNGAEGTTGNGITSTYENVLFLNAAIGYEFASARNEPHFRNCAFAKCNYGMGAALSAIGPGSQLTGCLFAQNIAGDFDSNAEGFFTSGSYNATTAGTAPTVTNVTNWITSISSTDNVDLVSPSTNDYRGKSGGALDDADQSGSAPATDMFGTARPQGTNPDIGYYEIVAAAASSPSPIFQNYYRHIIARG